MQPTLHTSGLYVVQVCKAAWGKSSFHPNNTRQCH